MKQTDKRRGKPDKPREQGAASPRHAQVTWVWPVAVIGLIVLGMGWTFSLLYFSRLDGGPRVIEDYYDKAVRWDALRAEAGADSLGSRSAHSDTSLRNAGLRDSAVRDDSMHAAVAGRPAWAVRADALK